MDSKELLQQIIRTAESIKQELRCIPELNSGLFTRPNLPGGQPLALNIPSPSHLIPELIEAGAPTKVAEAISEKYHAYAEQLANHQSNVVYTDALEKLRRWPSQDDAEFVTKFQEAHRRMYYQLLSNRKGGILDAVREKFSQRSESFTDGHKSKHFDLKSVPLLEKCFNRNQRPGREDKELLARKTGMSYRQINVWFQNRRSRIKKSSEKSDAQSGEPVCSSRASSTTLVGDDPLLNCVVPSYAFPVQYPPEVLEDPFPCRYGDFSSFSKPCWPRTPSTTRREPPDLDISGLAAAFGKLRISDAVKKGGAKKQRSSTSKQDSASRLRGEVAWPLMIRPLRAPLAALIRTGNTCLHRLSCTSSPEGESGKRDASTNRNEENPPLRARKARQCAPGQQRRTAISMKQQQALQTPAGSLSSATFSDPSPPPRVKKTEKRAPRARRSTRRGRKADNAPDVEIVEAETPKQSPEPLTSQSSPTPSIESLPSLSYSSGSSSSSTYAQSPPSSFSTLSDDGHSPPLDAYQSTDYSLTLPTSQTGYDEYPTSTSAFDGFSFDLAKGPLDHSLNFGLPEYPSYSDTFDSLSQELQSSSDFAPLLSFESPPLAS